MNGQGGGQVDGGKGGLSLTVEHQSINVVTVVEKSPFYNHHSKEWFSKTTC